MHVGMSITRLYYFSQLHVVFLTVFKCNQNGCGNVIECTVNGSTTTKNLNICSVVHEHSIFCLHLHPICKSKKALASMAQSPLDAYNYGMAVWNKFIHSTHRLP